MNPNNKICVTFAHSNLTVNTIRRIGVILLLLVFLFGTTGLSVLRHICNSSHEKNITVYPEFFKSSGDACCDDETTGYASACSIEHEKDAIPQNVEAMPCCITTISLFKLEILTEQIHKLTIGAAHAFLPLGPFLLLTIPDYKQPRLEPAHFQFFSPPLFGKLLVQYLHQMKIPAHPSFF